jgi:Mor family transcriptional regulator
MPIETGGRVEKNGVYEELIGIVGREAADRLVDAFAGSSIYIPQSIATSKKHRLIKEEFKNGESYRELSLKYHYTESYIRSILHRKPDNRQQEESLFNIIS